MVLRLPELNAYKAACTFWILILIEAATVSGDSGINWDHIVRNPSANISTCAYDLPTRVHAHKSVLYAQFFEPSYILMPEW